MAPAIVLLLIFLFVLFFIFYKRPKKKVVLPPNYKELLTAHVAYYNRLGKEDKRRFEDKIKEFLGYVRIDGIETTVDDLDKLLVASSAVIPIFGFNKWQYNNLRNVLLYPASFNRDEFLAEGFEKHTLGMVGTGPMQRVMILSKPALHYGFSPAPPKQNTGIHEFVHLLDKEDGDVDGLPEALLNRKFNKSEYLAGGYEKNTLGMIGNGPMQRVMILSKPAVRNGFQTEPSRENTGIHEFVHLLDKEDGDVDGLPEALLNRKYNHQWIELVNKNMEAILTGASDINYYGASNKAEFFAVASEYFFNCPELFKENHPQLFEGMSIIFNQNPIND